MARCMWHSARSKSISVCIQIMYVYVSLLVCIICQNSGCVYKCMNLSTYFYVCLWHQEAFWGSPQKYNGTMLLAFLVVPFTKHETYCWWVFEIRRSPVDMADIPLFTGFQKHPRWWAGFLNHQQYDLIHQPLSKAPSPNDYPEKPTLPAAPHLQKNGPQIYPF